MRNYQPAFSGGEITPLAHGRTDVAKYGVALKKCRNFIIRPHGCLMNRPGSQYIATTKYSGEKRSKLIPFVFSDSQSYVLEFGEGYIAIYADGLVIGNTVSVAITNITIGGTPSKRTITTAAPHLAVLGGTVVIADVIGTGSYAPNGTWTVLEVVSPTVLKIKGVASPTGSYTSGGTLAVAQEIASPYLESDLPNLRFAQSADVLTVTSGRLPQYELRRIGANSFTFTQVVYNDGPFMDVNSDNRTVQASAATGAVTLTASDPIFTADHVGGLFYLEANNFSALKPWEPQKVIATGGASPVNQVRRNDSKVYLCTAAPATATDTATGSIPPTHEEGTQMDGDGNPVSGVASVVGVSWTYGDSGYGIVLISGFTDSTHVTGTVIRQLPASVVSGATDLWAPGAWSDANGYPRVVVYFQDRQFFASTEAQPQTVWASKTALYKDFGFSVPSQDDDTLAFTLNARQINGITDLIPLESLIASTSTAVWEISAGQDNVLKPSTVGFRRQNATGAASVQSVDVGESALYVQSGGRKLRDLIFDFSVNKFTGGEVSLLAEHLFPYGTSIARLDYAKEPFSLVHCVRSDGIVPVLAYLREQEVNAWSTFDTDGDYEDFCSIVESTGVISTYVIARRDINGSSVRYIERFANREFANISDAYFVDAGISYDGRNTTSVTMMVSGGTNWTTDEALTLTASSASGWDAFSVGDIGNEIVLDDGNDQVRLKITGFTLLTQVTVNPVTTVPSQFRGVATTDWSFAKDVFSGADHLEGKTVSILADGMDVDEQIVIGGSVSLQVPASVVHVGLPFVSDMETLDVNLPGSESVRNRTKSIPKVTALVYASRGIFIGPDEAHLDEVPQRLYEDYADPTGVLTGRAEIPIPTTPDKDGKIFIRQSRPLPLTVLALLPEIEFGA